MDRASQGIQTVRLATVRICNQAGTHYGQGLMLVVGGEHVVLTCHHVVAPLEPDDLYIQTRYGDSVKVYYDHDRSQPDQDAVVLRVLEDTILGAPRPALHALNPETYTGSLRAIALTYLTPDNFRAQVEAPTFDLQVAVSDRKYNLPYAFRLAEPSVMRGRELVEPWSYARAVCSA